MHKCQDKQLFRPGTGKDPFCERVVLNGDMLVIEDIHSQQPAATGPGAAVSDPVRFYAGTPLITQDGHALGTLCVTDSKPGQLSEVQRKALRSLARQIIQLLEFDVSLQILKSQYVQARQSEIELLHFLKVHSITTCFWTAGSGSWLLTGPGTTMCTTLTG